MAVKLLLGLARAVAGTGASLYRTSRYFRTQGGEVTKAKSVSGPLDFSWRRRIIVVGNRRFLSTRAAVRGRFQTLDSTGAELEARGGTNGRKTSRSKCCNALYDNGLDKVKRARKWSENFSFPKGIGSPERIAALSRTRRNSISRSSFRICRRRRRAFTRKT